MSRRPWPIPTHLLTYSPTWTTSASWLPGVSQDRGPTAALELLSIRYGSWVVQLAGSEWALGTPGGERIMAILPIAAPRPGISMARWPRHVWTSLFTYGVVFVAFPVLCLLAYAWVRQWIF